jgi:hypothetical protein
MGGRLGAQIATAYYSCCSRGPRQLREGMLVMKPYGSGAMYEYRKEILEQLLRHGIRPTPNTPPGLVMEYLNDLYRYEIRRLRNRLLEGRFPRSEYASRVVDLRRRYPLVSIPTRHWTR